MANPTIVTNVTKLELDALISGALLEDGLQYNITDRGIRLTAISANQFNPDGLRTMLCPADYAIHTDAYGNKWIGVWNERRTPLVNDLTIWGGLVWKNLTGEVGTFADDYSLDLINWVVIPKDSFTNHEYISMVFNVNYVVENDWINKQWDSKGNILGMDKSIFTITWGDTPNLIDCCDWNFETSGFNFYDNVLFFIYNNSSLGAIYSNRCLGSIMRNSNDGEIGLNTNAGEIYDNSNDGVISYNMNLAGIYSNSSIGDISANSCARNPVNGEPSIFQVPTQGFSASINSPEFVTDPRIFFSL